MKFSKIVICLSCFISSITLSAPTDYPDAHNPQDIAHHNQECQKPEKSNLCPPNLFEGITNEEIAWELKDLTKDIISMKSNVYTELQTMEKILNDFSSKIAIQKSKSKENTDSLAELALYTTEEITSLSSAFASQNAVHQEIQLNMKQLDNKLRAVYQDIHKLNKKINSSLATQAALSGLFQPDEKDTMNFSVSVGGYHTDVALAMGIGYRFNRNVATRAGIAFSPNSRLSYNTAINFAW